MSNLENQGRVEAIAETLYVRVRAGNNPDTGLLHITQAEFVAAVAAQVAAARVDEAKAYGGCTKCYGKGYATVSDRWLGHDTDTDVGSPGGYVSGGEDFAMKFCSCDRGKQLERLTTRITAAAKVEELEALKKMRVRGQVPVELRKTNREAPYRRGFNAGDVAWADNVNARIAQLRATPSSDNKETNHGA